MTGDGWPWRDLVFEAQRRAALTRLRYRVHYDPANRLWSMTETTTPTPPGETTATDEAAR